jgi:hypothetical protein
MSLLTFLQQPDVRDRFNQAFPKPKLTPTPPLLAPPLTKNYALVGRAFDYLLRFQIKALNPHAIEQGWVAQNALHFLKCNAQTRLYDQAYLMITEAKEHYADFLKTQTVTDTLIVSALRLAKIEAIYRSKKIDPNLDQIADDDIVDLKTLLAHVNVKQFTSPKPILLNPTFELASQVVGGADADLVLGDALIDIKTVKEFSLERRDFNQILGYYVLSKLAGIDNAPTGHELKRLGIYFSRYAYLYQFDVSDVIEEETFPQFLDWFKRRCDPSGLLDP